MCNITELNQTEISWVAGGTNFGWYLGKIGSVIGGFIPVYLGFTNPAFLEPISKMNPKLGLVTRTVWTGSYSFLGSFLTSYVFATVGNIIDEIFGGFGYLLSSLFIRQNEENAK